MASLTEERIKEMEEEMSRFEQEILAPGDEEGGDKSHGDKQSNQGNSTQFIPHQVQRFHPPRPGMRPMFMGRGLHPFPPPPMMRPPMGMGPPHPGFARPMGRNFMPQPMFQGNVNPVPTSPNDSVIVAAPTIYAAAPTKAETKPEPEPPAEVVIEPIVPVTKEMIVINRPKETFSIANMEEHLKKRENKKKKMVRMAGNQVWEDNSLLEWEYDDFRIFCGDLGNDVTDEVLTRAFCKYPSFVKAKVVRDKRTNKTKGFGFVSYKDPQDFIKAMREMNGKYVGSRPIKLRKSCWRDRNIEVVKKKQKEKEKLGLL